MYKINRTSLIYSTLSFIIFGLGVSLQLKADIGQSVLNALVVTLSSILNLKVGTVLNAVNFAFFIAYLLLRRTKLRPPDVLQIIATAANGYVINFFLYRVLPMFTADTYSQRLLLYLTGLMIASVSLGAFLAVGIAKFPLESLCLAISETGKVSFTAIRLAFDLLFLIGAIIAALSSHTPIQIREGTLISVLLLSPLLGLFYKFFKKHLYLEE